MNLTDMKSIVKNITNKNKPQVDEKLYVLTQPRQYDEITNDDDQSKDNYNYNYNQCVKFNCRGTIIEVNSSTIAKMGKLAKIILQKTPNLTSWKLNVNPNDFHIFLDYLNGYNKNIVDKNQVVQGLCDELGIFTEIKQMNENLLVNLCSDIVSHVLYNIEGFVSVKKDNLVNINMMIPKKIFQGYELVIKDFDDLITENPSFMDGQLFTSREINYLGGTMYPGTYHVKKIDGNYYVDAACETIDNITKGITHIVNTGNFEVVDKTKDIITVIRTECPDNLKSYLRNFNANTIFDAYMPEYSWITRKDKSLKYPAINIPTKIILYGILVPILNFVPSKTLKGYEYSKYPGIRIFHDREVDMLYVELFKLEWDIKEVKKKMDERDVQLMTSDDKMTPQLKNNSLECELCDETINDRIDNIVQDFDRIKQLVKIINNNKKN